MEDQSFPSQPQEPHPHEMAPHLRHPEDWWRPQWEDLLFLVEMIPQLIWIARPDGFNTMHNRRWYAYTGATPAEGEAELWITFLHPDDRARALATWHTALATGRPYEVEYRVREGTTGEYHWFLVRALPLTDEEGHILKWFGTYTNIDPQKRTEEELRQSRDAFRMLLEALPQLIWTTYPDGTEEYSNHQWIEYTGLPFEDVRGGKGIACFHPDDREKILAIWSPAPLPKYNHITFAA